MSVAPRWAERSGRLAELAATAELDCVLVSDLVNVHYLTGYAGSNGLVCLTSGERRFLTDFRYASAVDGLRERWDVRIVDQNLVAAVAGSSARRATSTS